jgi:hypothetical protein
MDVFIVICRGPAGETFKIYVLADNSLDAMAQSRRRGHDVDQAVPLYPAESAAKSPRVKPSHSRGGCVVCGYALRGLPVNDGTVRCPECGKHQFPIGD